MKLGKIKGKLEIVMQLTRKRRTTMRKNFGAKAMLYPMPVLISARTMKTVCRRRERLLGAEFIASPHDCA